MNKEFFIDYGILVGLLGFGNTITSWTFEIWKEEEEICYNYYQENVPIVKRFYNVIENRPITAPIYECITTQTKSKANKYQNRSAIRSFL